jgi:hypothetical protein
MLTAFFKLCSENDFARTLAYDKVPGGTTWNKGTKQETVVGYPDVRKTVALGRVYVVHPSNSDCFHLRRLLDVVKGPTSFISLRTFKGKTYEIFQGFCKAIYLLEDDTHWESTLYEGIYAVQLNHLDICLTSHWPTYSLAKLS